MRETTRVGLGALAAATTLLQGIRRAHPTAGLYEAADLQWSWRTPRSTDALPQLVWVDDDDRPVAAMVAADEGDHVALLPLLPPDATPEQVALLVGRGLAHLRGSGFGAVAVEVDAEDRVLLDVLAGHGFAVEDDGVVETWLDVDARPGISPLADGYRLASRRETLDRHHHHHHHHMVHAGRGHPDVEPRLRQTSLYRDDLDLVVHDRDGAVAAYGLCWYDPETATGLVEPMRTEDDHQHRGLARHVLTAGLDRLAAAGAERVKICFEPGNAASSHLYLDVGFVPDRRTVVLARPA